MDEFAQTREPDDLFDDDFTAIEAETTYEQYNPTSNYTHDSDAVPITTKDQSFAAKVPSDSDTGSSVTKPFPSSSEGPVSAKAHSNSDNKTTANPHHVAPVRGPRHLTGGVEKPKLTEEELTAKMAAVRLNNAKRAEAYRLAEEDEASFQQREAKAQERRQVERQARRQMDMERERNRMRKLGAQAGRAWDEGKEETAQENNQPQYRRGANGAVPHDSRTSGGMTQGYQGGSTHRDARHTSNPGRGRDGSGRGRGRGGLVQRKANGNEPSKVSDPQADFPALPPATQPPSRETNHNAAIDSLQDSSAHGSWADQVTAEARG